LHAFNDKQAQAAESRGSELRAGLYLQRRYGDVIIWADRYIQVYQTLLVQLLQQLPVQVCHLAPPWLATILASFQLLWSQGSELWLTCSPQAESSEMRITGMYMLPYACVKVADSRAK